MKHLLLILTLAMSCSVDSEENNGNILILDFDSTSDMGSNPDTSPDASDSADSTNEEASTLIGSGENKEDSVSFVNILPAQGFQASDLEFNPENENQLWILQRRKRSSATCTEADPSGCGALVGYATILSNPGKDDQSMDRREDPNSWHFLRRPSALAFGAPGTWASCGEERTGNYLDSAADYMGPTLWSSDLNVFAKAPGAGLNGSHLDMLHETPFCVGIAHETENIYWLFNGDAGSIDKVDFASDHGPGHDDHADGKVFRYAIGELLRVEDVPSGMHFDGKSKQLYVVDSGNKRIITLDTTTGTRGPAIVPLYEQLADNSTFTNADIKTVVELDQTSMPSGLLYHDEILYLSDNATGKIFAFDLDGNTLASLETPFVNNDLSALTLGPDGKIYIANLLDSSVFRIDPIK